MANEIEIKVPDIGGANKVDVIEVLVKVGDQIEVDTPLITLESDKASMEIPSTSAGVVSKISVKVGDKVSEGDVILNAKSGENSQTETPKEEEPAVKEIKTEVEEPKQVKNSGASQLVEVVIPDIGGATDVDVIDIMVSPGTTVEKDQALITLEGDKATMDIPSPYAGTIKELKLKVGAKVSQGSSILMMETNEPNAQEKPSSVQEEEKAPEIKKELSAAVPVVTPPSQANNESSHEEFVSAGPSVRRMARELGVRLALVKGSGRKGRILKEDINAYVKSRLTEQPASGSAFNLPTAPVIDFSKFGEIETKPLNKIKRATGVNVHRSWVTIPHVTQFDEADITELESFRKTETESNKNTDYKLTVLAFVCAVVSKALRKYPQFNASLDASGENLIYKKYCNLGIAVETPNGLVVPVIKNVDQLTVVEIAKEMARLSSKAREKGLMPADMSGGCFTISSLGGIGGTAFTPIVNSPEVAILGLSRSSIKPIYQNQQFVPRLMLPLSLSYDHRVIDGAEAARFTRYIGDCLADIRKVLL
ncbi:dihydrolipoyllysine-residue acetyltransferase [Legionella sp. km772]|uniref:dihydrolipoyllysine-residue acetyltransferase n=1 Tax=Legionella sp. km772 TaxID=2498111 RepID=UPI000F8DEE11|nr:dihydrolipoyllysine-residue acetyltransferase [Legionella sp. km772]RUR11994.1 dihydrolipoyllysine-residue acetyltransferase [Legionella sp. km772]